MMYYPLLRFSGTLKYEPKIDAWFAEQSTELGRIAKEWFSKMRGCGSDVLEVLHDGYPTICVEDAPFAYVAVFRAHVNVGFFHGAFLNDPKHLLGGSGKYMRHVKLGIGLPVDSTALEVLITNAYVDIKERLEIERDSNQ